MAYGTNNDGIRPLVSSPITSALREINSYVERKAKSIGIRPLEPTGPSKCNAITGIICYLSSVPKDFPHYELSFVFLAHATILGRLPLQDRAQVNYFASLSPELNGIVHKEFLPTIYSILNQLESYDGFDILDGRLFARMLWEFTDPNHDVDFDDPVLQATQSLWEQITKDSSHISLDLVHFRKTFPRISRPSIPHEVDPDFSLSNFHHPALSQYLIDPLLAKAKPSNSSAIANSNNLFFAQALLHSELTHWHSGNKILPHPSRTDREKNEWLLKRRQRNDQLYRANMQRYAESITGQGLSQIPITKESSTSKIEVKSKKAKLMIADNKDVNSRRSGKSKW